MIRWLSFLLAITALQATPACWVLDEQALYDNLPADISPSELIQAIEDYGVRVSFLPSSQFEKMLLWEGKSVSIFLSLASQAPYHLWIASKTHVFLEDVPAEELQEFYKACWIARKAISEMLGTNSFLFFHTDQPRWGKTTARFGFELIPAAPTNQGLVIDAVEKSALNDYMLYNLPTHFPVPSLPSDKVLQLKNRLGELENQYAGFVSARESSEAKAGEPWRQQFLHSDESACLHLENIFQNLTDLGILIEGTLPEVSPEEGIREILINRDLCAFCNRKVIEKQLVYEWKGAFALQNHKPLSPEASFLILPKRHVTSWDLTANEVKATFDLIKALKKEVKPKIRQSDLILYVQDGPAVGQTVPHTHFHLIAIPSYLKANVSGLQHMHNKRPVLPESELRRICAEHHGLLSPILLNLQGCSTDE